MQSVLKPLSNSILSSLSSEGRNLTKSGIFAPMVRCKEASGRQYDQNICAMISHPLRANFYEFEKAKLFTCKRYNYSMTVSNGAEVSTMVAAILKTGADLNLVRENVVPAPWLVNAPPIRASVVAAGDTTFIFEGVIRLTVKSANKMKL